MKIDGSLIVMSASHQLENRSLRTEKLDVWVDGPQPDIGEDKVTLSDMAKQLPTSDKKVSSITDPEAYIEGDAKLFLIKKIIEALTGKKINLVKASEVESQPCEVSPPSQEVPQNQPEKVGWGVRYEYHESHSETEETFFRGGGIVKTADGKEIKFNIELNMSREFVETTDISLRAGDATRVDPLVINFNGTAAQLTDQRFAFDLNSDGRNENIPFVSGGSGILVFDRNGDQQVNDGSELFGPKTGNGFAELSQYDENKDRWIDENEPIYKNLYLWTKDLNGNDNLRSLKESGVGAIYVASVDSPFGLKDSNNNLKGQVTRSSIYLTENGQPGTIQQLNMVV